MTLPIGQQSCQWLAGSGPHGDVAVSSRVRLARNLAGHPFLTQASDPQRTELRDVCKDRILASDLAPQMIWVDLSESTRLDRMLLVERHLISRQHSRAEHARGVAISSDESMTIMVNEEDHLRMQSLRSGIQLTEAYAQVNQIDDALEQRMDLAYSSKFGYLTACPTNVGTGIRVSVMLHLPALKMTGEIEKLQQAAKDMHLAVRGFYGEGTEAVGDMFQVSNQTTLGRSEAQILDDFQDVVIPEMIEFERRARTALSTERAAALDDRVYRAWGILCNARLLGSEETMYLLSNVRLGICMGRITDIDLPTLNNLFLLTQPAHLQKLAGQPLARPERRRYRATYIRERLGVG